MSNKYWGRHYKKDKSNLEFPDENLVRMLKGNLKQKHFKTDITAVDLGCGSGRHLKLVQDFGIKNIIGTDSSLSALKLSRKIINTPLIQSCNKNLPLKNKSSNLTIAWGSLHYSPKDDLPIMLKEIYRILRPGGLLFATLRSERDTYLKRGKHLANDTWITDLKDIKGTTVSFFSEKEVKSYFQAFKKFQYGLIERSLMGNIDKILSHWIILAEK